MNVNFGLFPPLANPPLRREDGRKMGGTERGMAKKRAISARALADLEQWDAAATPPMAAE
jgi:methylenetetrahydrofolate--tRNA-(uracil-5-)-methyltransferase